MPSIGYVDGNNALIAVPHAAATRTARDRERAPARVSAVIAVALCPLLIHLPRPALAQSDTGADQACELCAFRKDLFADTREVFTAPVHWDHQQRRTVARNALIVIGAMALLDKPVADFVQDRRSASSERIADAFEPFGETYALGVVLSYAIAGKVTGNRRIMDTARNGTISSIIAAGLVAPALKAVTGRSRPNADQGEYDFDPFSGSASFPSGHTTEAFAVATSIAVNSDRRWVKGLAYGTATMVGYARIEHNAHWLSDTVAGALIGIGVAKTVNRANGLRHAVSLGAAPVADGFGVSISRAF